MKRRKKGRKAPPVVEEDEAEFEKVKARDEDFLIRLNVGESVVLQCRSVVTLTVLSGTIETLGATLTPSLGPVEALSPPNGSVLQLVATDMEPFGSHPGTIAIIVTPPTMEDDVLSAISFEPVSPVRHIAEFPSWRTTVDRILAREIPSVAVMGAKGAGKSTFTRYCVNRLLEKHSRVCYIDTDIGQPELTAPGLLSLTVIDRPLLYTEGAYSGSMRMHSAQHSYFVGAATPSACPLLYVDALRKAAECYRRDYGDLPIVLNTMGWVIGIGMHMVNTILDLARVEMLVRLGEIPDPENDTNVFLDYFDVEECPDRVVIDISPEEMKEGRMVRTQTIPAFELRWLRFFFHFRPDIRTVNLQGLPMAAFFGQCTAHRVPLCCLKFAFQEVVAESEVTTALVGVLVAVVKIAHDAASPLANKVAHVAYASARAEANSPDTETRRELKFVSGIDTAHEVVSFALVHSFTEDAVILYTPPEVVIEEDEQLLLLRGSLFWSPAKRNDEHEPYNCTSCITGLSSGSKVNSTRLVPRKRMRGN